MSLLDCDDLNGPGELIQGGAESIFNYAVTVLEDDSYTISEKKRLLQLMPRLVHCLGSHNLARLFEVLTSYSKSESTLVLLSVCKALPDIAAQVCSQSSMSKEQCQLLDGHLVRFI